MTPAFVSVIGIQLIERGHPEGGRYPNYELTAEFTYSVVGVGHYGHYRESFTQAADASQMERSLKNGPLFVRYDPKDPSNYFLDPYRDVRMTS